MPAIQDGYYIPTSEDEGSGRQGADDGSGRHGERERFLRFGLRQRFPMAMRVVSGYRLGGVRLAGANIAR